MDDTTSFSYPPIDPTTFDLIIVGTGLPESILAAAASSSGKTVLHLDPNPFYGSHFSSLPLSDLPSFLLSHSPSHLSDPADAVSVPLDDLTTPSQSDGLLIPVDLTTRPIYSHVDISSPSPDLLANSRKFNLDLAGPRVLFCADSAVDLMLKSGANQYVEFKNIDGNYVYGGDGTLSSVPDSRSAVFKDASLGLAEKNRLGSFFKLIEGHLKEVEFKDGGGGRISVEDLERPFVEFLDKMRLPAKIKSIIIYAIAMADYDQDNLEGCKSVLKTKDGINRLALYRSSVGRFHNALGALIYPIYGHGELCQAFCRRAAVKGCLYVLRMPVKALLVDKEGSCKGAKLASGQDLFSNEIVLGPSFMTLMSSANSSPDFLQAKLFDVGRGVGGKVARGICITNSSLKTNVSTCLVVYPPKSLYSEQVTSIRVLQIGSSLAVCPSGMFVVYLSTLCDDAIQGKKSVHAAINTMFSVPISETPENSSNTTSENTEVKPTLLWSALYVQEMTTGSYDSLCFTPMPDGNLNYSDLLDATEQLFHKMFPEEKFFPETTFSQLDDDGDLGSPNSDSLES